MRTREHTDRKRVMRREFLRTVGSGVLLAASTGALAQQAAQKPPRVKGSLTTGREMNGPAPVQTQTLADGLEQRAAAVIQAYDAQGNHRTGTEVDEASAEWLARQVRQLGAEPSLEGFSLSRVDPQSCYLRIADRRIEGMPLLDAGFTDAEGVRGKLGPIGSDSEIGLAETTAPKLTELGFARRSQIAEARNSRHKAIVLVTRGSRPGLFLNNASVFSKPFGPPMLPVSSADSEWLEEQARRLVETTIVVHTKRTMARAFNITAKIAGTNPALAPIVLMAPRSGWWQCASEQGSRLACWLEAMRVLAAGNPARDCFFVALSGHELGYPRNRCISQQPARPDQARERVDFLRLQHWRTPTA